MVSIVTSTKERLSFDLSIRNNSERVKFLRRRSKERGFLLLRFRRVLFGLAILILVSGILLFAITIFHETHTSTSISTFKGDLLPGGFGYGPATFPLDSSTQSIIGTSGIADLIILTTPWKDFNNWVCNQLPHISKHTSRRSHTRKQSWIRTLRSPQLTIMSPRRLTLR